MAAGRVVVDTNIVIRHLRTPPSRQRTTILAYMRLLADCHVVYVTVYELYLGATDQRKVEHLDFIMSRLRFLEGTARSARRAGLLHRHLMHHGWDVGAMDSLIAAACLEADLPLLTTNIDHFLRVPGLVVLSPNQIVPKATVEDLLVEAKRWNADYRRQRGYDAIPSV